jgi:hypothetical protein
LGSAGLPDDLHWLYRYFMPYSLMQMKPRTFGLLTGRGSVGHGVFDYCSWHKTEHENILKIAGIEIKDCDRAAPDERTYNLGAFEHAEMIKTYIETKSMNKTATATARSFKTVRNHLLEHNMGINQLGECQKCFNSKGEFSKQKVEIGKVGRPQKSEVIKRASTKTSTESAPVEEKKAKHFQEVSLE